MTSGCTTPGPSSSTTRSLGCWTWYSRPSTCPPMTCGASTSPSTPPNQARPPKTGSRCSPAGQPPQSSPTALRPASPAPSGRHRRGTKRRYLLCQGGSAQATYPLTSVVGTEVKLAEPATVLSVLMSYWASAAGMVSARVPVPVAETDAVQPAPKPRSSVTWPGAQGGAENTAGEGGAQLTVAGVVTVSGPATTATVTLQSGPVAPAGQVLPVAAGIGVVHGDRVGDGGAGGGGGIVVVVMGRVAQGVGDGGAGIRRQARVGDRTSSGDGEGARDVLIRL
jgi:hypothetical protein